MATQDPCSNGLQRWLAGVVELSAFGSVLALGLFVVLAATGADAYGLFRVLLAVVGAEALISGILHLAVPGPAVGFWRCYNERRPAWRRAFFGPVDVQAARSQGIGQLLGAVACLLLVTGLIR